MRSDAAAGPLTSESSEVARDVTRSGGTGERMHMFAAYLKQNVDCRLVWLCERVDQEHTWINCMATESLVEVG